MKRFLVFAWDVYYPLGGWNDLKDSFDTRIEAEAYATSVKGDWKQIVDTKTGERTSY